MRKNLQEKLKISSIKHSLQDELIMLKPRILSTLIPTLIIGVVAGVIPQISLAKPVTTISVLPIEAPCFCGSHGGGFEALYNGKNISVNFSYNPNPANPIKYPVTVLKNNKPLEGWDSLLCSLSDEKCPIAGYKINVSGRWANKMSFDAYSISIK